MIKYSFCLTMLYQDNTKLPHLHCLDVETEVQKEGVTWSSYSEVGRTFCTGLDLLVPFGVHPTSLESSRGLGTGRRGREAELVSLYSPLLCHGVQVQPSSRVSSTPCSKSPSRWLSLLPTALVSL